MNQPSYKIVFNGELMPDAALETVKENLARLFKSDSARINALFTGATVTLKKDLAEHEADHYLEALQKAGARVRKELDLAASLSLVPTDEHAAETPVEGVSASMSCPKCGHEQPKAESCAACGIIIEKYVARQAQLAATPAASAVQPAASPYAPPRADVAETLPEFGQLKVLSVTGRIGRVRYLGWSMAMMLCALPLFGVGAGLAAASETLGMILIALVMLAMAAFSVCIGVQRLHDMGWSGWLWLLNFVPIVGGVFSLLMLIIPGTQGANRYGPPPPPNSTSVKVMAWLILLVPVIGILAAIAIPQYQSYVERAAQSEYSSDSEAR